MEILKKIYGYLTLKKDEGEGVFVKQMHTMNKITIVVFLIALTILIIKLTK
ncbi:DUF6728 family protein [uncultured Kiloniella sp.]|uniref:DUF6728 family protein n=1 Tax=uncultured Kiloniella sp. TaxID=1133091 RepID=UPI003459389A